MYVLCYNSQFNHVYNSNIVLFGIIFNLNKSIPYKNNNSIICRGTY